MRMIILAAGQGKRLLPLSRDRPKCLVELGGRAILAWQLNAAAALGIRDIVIVGGHCAECLPVDKAHIVVNESFTRTNMVWSLFCAERWFNEEFILSYGDIAYAPGVLEAILAHDAAVSVAVDLDWKHYWQLRFDDPLTDAESFRIGESNRIESIGQPETDVDSIEGQFIGLMAFRGAGVQALRSCYEHALRVSRAGEHPFRGQRPIEQLFMTDLLQGMVDLGHALEVVPVHGGWVEVDSLRDLAVADRLLKAGRLERG